MQKTLEVKLSGAEAERIDTAVKECDKSIRRLFKHMEKDQGEIEKLKAETRAMLAHMEAA
jgi:chaperonin cofactor prefoldin